jgi:hypothetical protein
LSYDLSGGIIDESKINLIFTKFFYLYLEFQAVLCIFYFPKNKKVNLNRKIYEKTERHSAYD